MVPPGPMEVVILGALEEVYLGDPSHSRVQFPFHDGYALIDWFLAVLLACCLGQFRWINLLSPGR